MIATTIPHAAFDGPDCCGCLKAIGRTGLIVDFVCNECGAVIACSRAEDVEAAIHSLELSGAVATAICPHCDAANLVVGLSRVHAFVCQGCGKGVDTGSISDG